MSDARARLVALASKLYETRPVGVDENLHNMIPGRTWVLVGREGKRWWVKFLAHRDMISICALDNKNTIVLRHDHILRTWTAPEEPPKQLSDRELTCKR